MYLCRGTILLKCFTLIIFLQTCNARKSKHHYCPPSACGHIRNIRDPFHLNTDPKDCHYPGYELACEGNQTVMWLFSEKLHVQGIDYHNKKIRLVDPTLQTQDDLCSFRPQFNINQYYSVIDLHYYTCDYSKTFLDPIFLLNCPFAVNNSAFVEISGCKLSRYTYLKIGETKASEVNDGCRVQFIGLTSWPNIKDAENNISLSDFHQAILYGFELRYYLWRSPENISDIERIFSEDSTFSLHILLIF
ncbi:uncharacterized protein LOC125822990 [Solanum verrucosum]|uniref:uncharacterized protein LOC125813503 n=1 Tax=Solanum verrucosum TaxID=315347 RepID=UPI0020D197A4|nr:uncharacterized protein LOC125813503 [Solanum verrucosum]XP_049358400.1 uncharacterized protein LOC125822990 [Solanum verrucosum]